MRTPKTDQPHWMPGLIWVFARRTGPTCCLFCRTPAQIWSIDPGRYEPPHDRTNQMTVRPANLGIRPDRLESSLCAPWVAEAQSFSSCGQRRLWSDWAHVPFCWFCNEAAPIGLLSHKIYKYDSKARIARVMLALPTECSAGARVQTRLGNEMPVEPLHDKTNKMACASSKDSD